MYAYSFSDIDFHDVLGVNASTNTDVRLLASYERERKVQMSGILWLQSTLTDVERIAANPS
jgi:hypothetical protein